MISPVVFCNILTCLMMDNAIYIQRSDVDWFFVRSSISWASNEVPSLEAYLLQSQRNRRTEPALPFTVSSNQPTCQAHSLLAAIRPPASAGYNRARYLHGMLKPPSALFKTDHTNILTRSIRFCNSVMRVHPCSAKCRC